MTYIIPTADKFVLDIRIGNCNTLKERDLDLYRAYTAWKGIKKRLTGTKCHIEKPTYVGTAIDVEWLKFSIFQKWFNEYYVEGWELDKDLRVPGSRIYGREYCMYIPKILNNLFNDNRNVKSEYPLGVDFKNGRYRAQCHQPWKHNSHIGHYSSPLEAHGAWLETKIEVIQFYQEIYQSYPIIVEALDNWIQIFALHLYERTEYSRNSLDFGYRNLRRTWKIA